MPAPVIVWFRQDLRLGDNPALQAALDLDRPIVPVYIRDDTAAGRWQAGGASRWWLHGSLGCLDADLRRRGSRLTLRTGDSLAVLSALIRDTDSVVRAVTISTSGLISDVSST
jgi:deoxyribodipyrimidine photo-lyase